MMTQKIKMLDGVFKVVDKTWYDTSALALDQATLCCSLAYYAIQLPPIFKKNQGQITIFVVN